MKEYTLFFEIFGHKKKYIVIASSEESAKENLHEFIINNTIVAKTTGVPIARKPKEKFDNYFKDFFNKF